MTVPPDPGAVPESRPAADPIAAGRPAVRGAAHLVAGGILLSRVAGLIRDRIFAQYFGISLHADAFRAALRMPNALQNLLGEGTLSASFIPVYAELLEQGRQEEAGRVAGAIFALLCAIAGALSLVGIAAAPLIVSVFTPGFSGLQRDLTIAAVRIIFPMTGVLVLSAWALGVLNSHRRFFVSYVAPVFWNVAMIATLLILGPALNDSDLVVALSWGAFAGGVLQFLVQLPWVLRLERNLRIRWDLRREAVRTVMRNAVPAVLGRGVVQLSGYIDMVLASFLAAGAVSAISYAQTLYLLPVSLFGMSVAAAELPELARERLGTSAALAERVRLGLTRMALLVVPSAVGYMVLGDIVVAALYQTGDFTAQDARYVHVLLGGYALGLLASTATRLYSSAFFALQDTRTPARIAVLRVTAAAALGAGLMLALRGVEYAGHSLAAAGLTVGAAVGAWLEWTLLRRSLGRRIGVTGAGRPLLSMIAAAALAAVLARGLDWLLPPSHPIVRASAVLGIFGSAYFALASVFGVAEARRHVVTLLRRVRPNRGNGRV